jgi:hypothetical protein
MSCRIIVGRLLRGSPSSTEALFFTVFYSLDLPRGKPLYECKECRADLRCEVDVASIECKV